MPKIASLPLAVAALSLSLTACGDDKETGAPALSSTPTAPVSSTPTAPPPSATGPVTRTDAELAKALLELKEMPTGFALVPNDPAEEGGTFSSKDSKCKTLVKYLNADVAPGAKASAVRSFSGGQEGPYIDFSLDALGTSKAAGALQLSFKQAVKTCKKITLRIPEQGSSPMEVEEVSAPKVGEDPHAFRLTGLSGPLEGLEFSAALTGLNDVVVSVFILAGQPGELEGATEEAYAKARTVLGT